MWVWAVSHTVCPPDHLGSGTPVQRIRGGKGGRIGLDVMAKTAHSSRLYSWESEGKHKSDVMLLYHMADNVCLKTIAANCAYPCLESNPASHFAKYKISRKL
jgi:hypothetical protein